MRHKHEAHFDFIGGVEKRITWLIASFSINKKQIDNSKIRFFNSIIRNQELLPEHKGKGIIPSYTDHEVEFQIPGRYFSETNYFRSVLITFVESNLRGAHRKITSTITAVPSREFAPHILHAQNRVQHTKLSVSFHKSVQLNLPFDRDRNQRKVEGNVSNFTVNGPVGAFGPNATATNFEQNFTQGTEVSQLLKLLKAVNQDPANNLVF